MARAPPPQSGPHIAASITGRSIDFPAWATGRTNWGNQDLTIDYDYDYDYAAKFLDTISVI
jgi:hypothetical protein